MVSRIDAAVSRVAEKAGQDSARVEISGLTKRFLTPAGEVFTALQDVSFTVEPGQFCAVVGPTGCGKSTTLGMVSGLDRPSEGIGQGRRPRGRRRHRRRQLHVPGRRAAALEDRPGQRADGPGLPQGAQAAGPGLGTRLATPGGPVGVRGPLPAPALRRYAQARGDGRGADQRTPDPDHGRAVRRPGRADQGDHVDRTARPVGADPAVGHLHHPRPRRGRGPRRPGRRHDLQPRHRSRRSSTSTCPARAARSRRSASSPASSNFSTRSGTRCARRWSAPTHAPQEVRHEHDVRCFAHSRQRQRTDVGRGRRQTRPPAPYRPGVGRSYRPRGPRHRRLAGVHHLGDRRPVLLRASRPASPSGWPTSSSTAPSSGPSTQTSGPPSRRRSPASPSGPSPE